MLASHTISSPSTSTGMSRSGHSRASSAKESASPSIFSVKGVSFSCSAISTFWQ